MGIGRNKELANLRDKALFDRYFYWTEEKKMRADWTLKQLEQEFFISESRILSVIRKVAQNELKTSGRDIIRERSTKRRFSGLRGVRTA